MNTAVGGASHSQVTRLTQHLQARLLTALAFLTTPRLFPRNRENLLYDSVYPFSHRPLRTDCAGVAAGTSLAFFTGGADGTLNAVGPLLKTEEQLPEKAMPGVEWKDPSNEASHTF